MKTQRLDFMQVNYLVERNLVFEILRFKIRLRQTNALLHVCTEALTSLKTLSCHVSDKHDLARVCVIVFV